MLKRLLQGNILFWTTLALLAFAGGYVIFYSTAVAPWAFSDSTVYIAAGINWIKGNGMGFVQPDGLFASLVHFPPGYPVLIGLTSLLLPDPITAIRWINIISFILLIFLGGLLLYKITNSKVLPLLYGILLVFSPFLVMPFSGAMSEAPAILAGTLALLLLVRYRQTNRMIILVVAGLLAAAAVFIRYQQAAILLAGGIFLLILSHQNWKTRLKDTLWYAFFSAGPFVLWLALRAIPGSANAPRKLGLRGSVADILQTFLSNTYNTVKYWFPWRTGLFPAVDASTMRFILVALFVFLLVFAAWRWHKSGKRFNFTSPVLQLLLVCALYILADLLFLWAAMLIASPPPDVDNRMLSPLLPVLFILLLVSVYLAGKPFNRRWPYTLALIAVTLLFCITFAKQERKYLVNMHYAGEGFTSITFKNSPLVEKIRELDQEAPLITNSPALVQFFTLREPYRTFEGSQDPAIGLTIRYGDTDTPRQKIFREECAVLVIFDPDLAFRYNPESALYFPPGARGVTKGLDEVFSDKLGNIYLYPGCEGR